MFSITLAVSILISALVSLTLTPMMSARLLKHTPPERQSRFYRKSGEWFDRVIARYGAMLNWVLDRQKTTLLVAIGTLALTVLLYIFVPKGFFPVQDTGVIQGITEAPESVSSTSMAERQQAIARVVLEDPAVESLSSFIGVDGTNVTMNSGRMLINLKAVKDRDANAVEVIRRLQTKLANVQGIILYMQPVQDLTIESRVSRTQYQFTVESANPDDLSTWVPRLVDRLRELHEVADVASDLSDQGLQAYVEIDRATASRLGVTTAAIDNALYNAFGQRLISTIYTQSSQYRVVLEVNPAFQIGPSSLNDLYVMPTLATSSAQTTGTPQAVSSSGGAAPVVNTGATQTLSTSTAQPPEPVRLSSIARISERPTALVINHLGQFPSTTISFNLAPNYSLGHAVDAIRKASAEIGMPASVRTRFQGAASAFQASLSNTLLLILAAIVTMYIVLGVLYESYIHPVTILSTLPTAGVGALLALLISGTDLGIVAIIGIILLIGIVKKNAIMMIDFALDAEREEGKSPREAIYQACLLRFRPILMTTMAALLAALPLMLGTGVGSELRHPLGLTMVGGLLVSQVLTLFTTPVIYLAFDRVARRTRARFAAHDIGDVLPQPSQNRT